MKKILVNLCLLMLLFVIYTIKLFRIDAVGGHWHDWIVIPTIACLVCFYTIGIIRVLDARQDELFGKYKDAQR